MKKKNKNRVVWLVLVAVCAVFLIWYFLFRNNKNNKKTDVNSSLPAVNGNGTNEAPPNNDKYVRVLYDYMPSGSYGYSVGARYLHSFKNGAFRSTEPSFLSSDKKGVLVSDFATVVTIENLYLILPNQKYAVKGFSSIEEMNYYRLNFLNNNV